MNTEKALEVIKGLLDAFDIDNHDDYFFFHGTEVCEAVISMYVALEEAAERENPKPLTLKELKEQDGMNVYTITSKDALSLLQKNPVHYVKATVKMNRHMWMNEHRDVIEYENGACRTLDSSYGETWLAYAHEPKEARKEIREQFKTAGPLDALRGEKA